ncbi:UNVERIFIED_CONTAM: NADPH-dependent aldehyde reductase-like protein, chloroplastic [Sesamum angustifolium]|uniref:NADPH-dependent aldehyde reductase-like protein, chloroplastic n=1 Tax=Sesamum angustifolium TaxID=2727405 RepID=A0AAW2PV17_9LAMI
MAANTTAATLSLSGRVAIVTGASRGSAAQSQSTSAPSARSSSSTTLPAQAKPMLWPLSSTPKPPTALILLQWPLQSKPTYQPQRTSNRCSIEQKRNSTLRLTSWSTARGFRFEAANRLARGGGGRIVLISSSIVGASLPGYGAYAGSKAAVETMTKIAAKELKGSGITVNCVAPGPVATELFLAGKSEEMVGRLVEACPLGDWESPMMWPR